MNLAVMLFISISSEDRRNFNLLEALFVQVLIFNLVFKCLQNRAIGLYKIKFSYYAGKSPLNTL